MLTSLTIRGNIGTATGYSTLTSNFIDHISARGIAIHFLKIGLNIKDIPKWLYLRLPKDFSKRNEPLYNIPINSLFCLHSCLPTQMIRIKDKININYTMFEADRIPSSWTKPSHYLSDYIIVPTESSRLAWLEAGIPSHKVFTSPLGVNTCRFHPENKPLPLYTKINVPISSYTNRFLNVSDYIERKNPLGLLRAWMQATTRHDDAILIWKINTPSHASRKRFQHDLKKVVQELKIKFSDCAPILFLRKVVSENEIPSLYTSATHYISLSHGEGWDNPMFEAAASGLKLIAPNHSAYSSYLDKKSAKLISSIKVPALTHSHLATLFKGVNWWEPNEAETIEIIQQTIKSNGANHPSAREKIIKQYSMKQSVESLLNILTQQIT